MRLTTPFDCIFSVSRLVDIEADGKLDLLIGKSNGEIAYYQNKGTKEQPNFQLQTTKYQNIDVGSYAQPAFQEFTSDGLTDLLVGESGGKLRLYNSSKKVTSGPDPATKFTYDRPRQPHRQDHPMPALTNANKK